MEDAVRIVAELVNRKTLLEQENARLKANCVDTERFHNVAMPIEMAGQLHGVSAKVIRRLVELGLIAKHPQSSDGKILIRASEAIRMDIDNLREQAKSMKYV